jgi:hypothetical protein
MLQGGRVASEGDSLYLYVFSNEDGSLKYALIVTKEHHANPTTIPGNWGAEFGEFYGLVLALLNGRPHNGYWNEGYEAGQRIMGHWHIRIEPRFAGQPATDMGLGLLITKYNQVMAT